MRLVISIHFSIPRNKPRCYLIADESEKTNDDHFVISVEIRDYSGKTRLWPIIVISQFSADLMIFIQGPHTVVKANGRAFRLFSQP